MPEAETPADTIRRAAALMRQSANIAANGNRGPDPNDQLTGWTVERVGGQERVLEIRRYPDGTGQEIIAVPTVGGVAAHIAALHPLVALAIADSWDATAARHRESEHYHKGCCAYCNVGEWPCPDMDDTLTAARAYLNETGA